MVCFLRETLRQQEYLQSRNTLPFVEIIRLIHFFYYGEVFWAEDDHEIIKKGFNSQQNSDRPGKSGGLQKGFTLSPRKLQMYPPTGKYD